MLVLWPMSESQYIKVRPMSMENVIDVLSYYFTHLIIYLFICLFVCIYVCMHRSFSEKNYKVGFV